MDRGKSLPPPFRHIKITSNLPEFRIKPPTIARVSYRLSFRRTTLRNEDSRDYCGSFRYPQHPSKFSRNTASHRDRFGMLVATGSDRDEKHGAKGQKFLRIETVTRRMLCFERFICIFRAFLHKIKKTKIFRINDKIVEIYRLCVAKPKRVPN